MGRFADLKHQALDVEARITARNRRIVRHMHSLKKTFRMRYVAGALVVVGLAAGMAVHRYLSMRGRVKAPRRVAQRTAAALRKRAFSLLPLAQVVYKQVKKRQSNRSASFADHSSARTHNGLLRH